MYISLKVKHEIFTWNGLLHQKKFNTFFMEWTFSRISLIFGIKGFLELIIRWKLVQALYNTKFTDFQIFMEYWENNQWNVRNIWLNIWPNKG